MKINCRMKPKVAKYEAQVGCCLHSILDFPHTVCSLCVFSAPEQPLSNRQRLRRNNNWHKRCVQDHWTLKLIRHGVAYCPDGEEAHGQREPVKSQALMMEMEDKLALLGDFSTQQTLLRAAGVAIEFSNICLFSTTDSAPADPIKHRNGLLRTYNSSLSDGFRYSYNNLLSSEHFSSKRAPRNFGIFSISFSKGCHLIHKEPFQSVVQGLERATKSFWLQPPSVSASFHTPLYCRGGRIWKKYNKERQQPNTSTVLKIHFQMCMQRLVSCCAGVTQTGR